MRKRLRIACFFTAGYTELNALKHFLRKVNADVDYIQLCPTASRRSKDAIRNRHNDNICRNQSGLTGDSLIDFILEFLGKDRFKEEDYDAILIEDDKDDRFLRVTSDGYGEMDIEAWHRYESDVKDRISELTDIPVLFLMASPEVEAWFYADYANGFGNVYGSELGTFKDTFRIRFRKYLNDNVVTSHYVDEIESYGIFDGTYRKLSEEIQDVLKSTDLAAYMGKVLDLNYSKRIEGEEMLYAIDPAVVKDGCKVFFAPFYWDLKKI